MPKTLLQIVISLLIIALCLGGYLWCCDAELDIYVEVPPTAEGYRLELGNENIVKAAVNDADGSVWLGLSPNRQLDARFTIHLTALGKGETSVKLSWEGIPEDSPYASEIEIPVSVNRFGIITDGMTGNFSGWTGVSLGISLALITMSVILFLAFRRGMKEDMYSYRTVAYLGFSLFLLVIGLLRARYLIHCLLDPSYGTVISMLIGISASTRSFMLYTSPFVFLFALALCVSNISLMKHEGVRLANMLGIIVGIIMIAGAGAGLLMFFSRRIYGLKNLIVNIYSGIFCYFECLLFATVYCGIAAAKHVPDYDKDYVLVLGCAIRPDGSLMPIVRGRVERAMEFVRKQFESTGKQAVLLSSGGKGSDECMAESEAMARYMLEHGVDEKNILIENQSTTTRENMRFSRALVDKIKENAKVAFSTTNYHVFRSGVLAKEIGWRIDGMGCPTKWYFWPNAFLREFVALLVNGKVQQIIMLLVITAASAALTAIMGI